MAIESRETTIGGTTYRVTQLGTKRGTSLLVRLVRLLGPGVGSLVGGLGRTDVNSLDSALAVGVDDAMHDLAMRLDDKEVQLVLEEFAKLTAVVQSDEIELRLWDIYDDHFAGRYDEMLRWAKFCMEVNFSSFFAAQSGSDKPLVRLWKLLQALPSRSTSAGTSTVSPAASATPQA